MKTEINKNGIKIQVVSSQEMQQGNEERSQFALSILKCEKTKEFTCL